jgi:hypothetical protein
MAAIALAVDLHQTMGAVDGQRLGHLITKISHRSITSG